MEVDTLVIKELDRLRRNMDMIKVMVLVLVDL